MVRQCPEFDMLCSTSKDWRSHHRVPFVVATLLLIAIPLCFYVFCGPYLVQSLSPAPVVVVAVLHIMTAILLLVTRFSNPGSLPKAELPVDWDNDFKYPLQREVQVRSLPVCVKWCRTCNFYRPPRASHCSSCNWCVEKFDHHCPWLDNCIGLHNYRYFLLLLATTFVFSLIVTSLAVTVTARVEYRNDEVFIGSICVSVLSGIVVLLVGGLFGFHVYLVSIGLTTNEMLSSRYDGVKNPFDSGWVANILAVACVTHRPRSNTLDLKASKSLNEPPISYNLSQRYSQPDNAETAQSAVALLSRNSVSLEDSIATANGTPAANVCNSDRSSVPSLLFNGSIDYAVPSTPTLCGSHMLVAGEDEGQEKSVAFLDGLAAADPV